MGKALTKLIWYAICTIICITGVVCMLKVVKNATTKNKTYGTLSIVDYYDDFNFFNFKVEDPTFYKESDGTYLMKVNVLKHYDFDGSTNKYNVFLNNDPCYFNTSDSGIITSIYSMTIRGLHNEVLAVLDLTLNFRFYSDRTEFYITADLSEDEYSYLLQYVDLYGLNISVFEEIYNTPEDSDEINNVLVTFTDSDNNVLEQQFVFEGNICNPTFEVPEGHNVNYYIGSKKINLANYSFAENTTVKVIFKVQTFNITFKTEEGVVLSSQTVSYNQTPLTNFVTPVGYDCTLQEELSPAKEDKTYILKTTLKDGYIALDGVYSLTNDSKTVTIEGLTEYYNCFIYYYLNNSDNGMILPSTSGFLNTKLPYTVESTVINPIGWSLNLSNNVITLNTSVRSAIVNFYYITYKLPTVTFKDGDTVISTYRLTEYGQPMTVPADPVPTDSDYLFNGWNNGTTTLTSALMSNSAAVYSKVYVDTVWTAVYKLKTYTVTFKVYGKGWTMTQTPTSLPGMYNTTFTKHTSNSWLTFNYAGLTDGSTSILSGSKTVHSLLNMPDLNGNFYVPSSVASSVPINTYNFSPIELAGSNFVGFSLTEDGSQLIDLDTWTVEGNTTIYIIYN